MELQQRAAAMHPVLGSMLQNGSAEEAFPPDVEAESNERFQRACPLWSEHALHACTQMLDPELGA